jgi:hypothetical protein
VVFLVLMVLAEILHSAKSNAVINPGIERAPPPAAPCTKCIYPLAL